MVPALAAKGFSFAPLCDVADPPAVMQSQDL